MRCATVTVGLLFAVFVIAEAVPAASKEPAPKSATGDSGPLGREIAGKDGAPAMLVPTGGFLYGSTSQWMSLPDFYMDKHEVTTARYAKFLQATGRKAPYKWNEVSPATDGNRPVIGIDWHDADAYCRHYGKRLPTEQEWEKSARGTDGRKYPWGNEAPARSRANYDWIGEKTWQGYNTLSPVDAYEAGKSPYGVYDMSGNVWEWTSSNYDETYKVLRGGSWAYDAEELPLWNRHGRNPTYRSYRNGFRCAQDAPH